MPNMGLFITAYSGLGRFVFGVNACRNMMPDPEFFQQCLYDSYAEVKAALQAPARKNAPKKQRKAVKKA